MELRKQIGLIALVLFAIAIIAAPASAQTAVDLELALLIDVSGSVNDTEFGLQQQGYIDAFNNASLSTAISNGAIGSIAVTLVYWSSDGQFDQAVGWTQIGSALDAQNFATAIGATSRPFGGLTAPGSAINDTVPLFTNDFDGTRRVIDISGDGSENDGDNTPNARNAAEALGITINGLPILGSESGLEAWYTANIKTTDGFVVAAANFNDFGRAVLDKLEEEIDPVIPEPATMTLLGTGLLGFFGLRRKKRS